MHPLGSYLKSRGLKQQDLARDASVSKSTISKVVRGRKRGFGASDAVRIFNALNGEVSIGELMMGVDDIALMRAPRRKRRAS